MGGIYVNVTGGKLPDAELAAYLNAASRNTANSCSDWTSIWTANMWS